MNEAPNTINKNIQADFEDVIKNMNTFPTEKERKEAQEAIQPKRQTYKWKRRIRTLRKKGKLK